jgi:hypothetical protein
MNHSDDFLDHLTIRIALSVPAKRSKHERPEVRVWIEDATPEDYPVQVDSVQEAVSEVLGAIGSHVAFHVAPRWTQAFDGEEDE